MYLTLIVIETYLTYTTQHSYPSLFRLETVADSYFDIRLAVLDHFQWNSVAVLYQAENLLTTHAGIDFLLH